MRAYVTDDTRTPDVKGHFTIGHKSVHCVYAVLSKYVSFTFLLGKSANKYRN